MKRNRTVPSNHRNTIYMHFLSPCPPFYFKPPFSTVKICEDPLCNCLLPTSQKWLKKSSLTSMTSKNIFFYSFAIGDKFKINMRFWSLKQKEKLVDALFITSKI